MSSLPTNVSLSINVLSPLGALGIYLPPLNLIWSPSVAVDGQVVDQGCQINWYLYQGGTYVDGVRTTCGGIFVLPLLLKVGDYSFIGQVALASGTQAQEVIQLHVGG